ncbi:PTS transporter subunit IIC [Streptococcus sp. CSL10205-OR2]|uniref:PTS transporter subunit IIC n=1 Tax=Streptococcus sp. CSL10205-OR2 TaxID=2980558 RepID=UPI0021D91381|nr:PTS sugar transporter subunit IIC [Streptococcus sp. CSL10205-OR2]MCU9533674.1 PTS sugar transporter subunit IIC [Streptococcus sp. CSL10205-OR2]
MENKLSAKAFAMNVLNGIATGSVVVLIPGALLSELVKLLLPSMPFLTPLSWGLSMSNATMGLVCGFMVGLNFKFNPIQSASLGLATLFASGSVMMKDGVLMMAGAGDIINMLITSALGAALILWVGNGLKAYTILVIPPLLMLVVGLFGRLILPYVAMITEWIGLGVAQLLQLQPLIMCMLIAMIFGILIVSPITTVGIALAINLSGIGSGAANLGVCATGFAFAILGWAVNTRGTSFAHFIGSPKISMPNVVKNPKVMLPVISSGACTGVLAYLFNIQGTPMSAGFGFSGLVGPLNHLNLASGGWSITNILITLLVFAGGPIVFGLLFKYLFMNVLGIVTPEDYRLNI